MSESTARVTGKVKWFDIAKGYGFITPVPDQSINEDVFVHITSMHKSKLNSLNQGDLVSFEIKDNKGRPQAIHLKIEH
jgi:CspA family cold shock protein